jgi:hypothetical protein
LHCMGQMLQTVGGGSVALSSKHALQIGAGEYLRTTRATAIRFLLPGVASSRILVVLEPTEKGALVQRRNLGARGPVITH